MTGHAGRAGRARRTHGSYRASRSDDALDYGGDFQDRRDFDDPCLFDHPTRDGG